MPRRRQPVAVADDCLMLEVSREVRAALRSAEDEIILDIRDRGLL